MNNRPPYWIEPYTTSFMVFVEDIRQTKDHFQIQIREDVIRPAGGGQAGDRGTLSVKNRHVSIRDTIIDSEKILLVSDSPVSVKSEGQLDIDIEWRTAMMKNHTSEHIFVSSLKKMVPDLAIGGLWIDGEHGSVEIMNVNLSFRDVFVAEKDVQRIISLDFPVQTEFADADKIDPSVRAREGLINKHDILRIVKVGELDRSACSGIHVERTGQIGFFKVTDVKHVDHNTKIEFVSGEKALSMTRDLYNSVLQRKYTYPFEIEQIGAILDRAKMAVDEKNLMIEKINQLVTKGANMEKVGPVEFRHEYLPGFESKTLKNLANQLSFSEPVILLLFAPGKKAQVILRTYHTKHDAKYYISEAVLNQGGKGGGSSENYTGGFHDVEDSMNLYNHLVSYVRGVLNTD
ncbi:MAG: hypothetical protein ACFFE6_02100 [Candidatus Thorarchaeota archaeon]